jgi:hypothetical protein
MKLFMASDLTTTAGILKRVYDDYVEHQQNLKTHAMDEVGHSLAKFSPSGEGFFGVINDTGNESVGAITENETFRTIDNENYRQYKVLPKINVAPIQFSGLLSKAAEGGEESFAKAVVDALDSARLRILKDENRQFFGLGTGSLTSPGSATASQVTSFSVSSTQYLRANMVIDIYTSTGGTSVITGLRLTDVDKVGGIVYVTGSLTSSIATTNVIVKQNILSTAPSDGKEMMGLRGIVDDSTDLTTFQNIDSTATRIWRGRRIDASSANLTSDLLQRVIDDVGVLSGETPDLILMHPKQRRKYLDIVVPQKRYNDQKLDAGNSKLSFNGIDLMLDVDCQDDTVYALTKSYLRKFEIAPMAMASQDGSDIYLRLSNQDAFQAYWRHYCNFGTSKRSAHGKIVNLAKPTGAA